jgi:hypothetical protein
LWIKNENSTVTQKTQVSSIIDKPETINIEDEADIETDYF